MKNKNINYCCTTEYEEKLLNKINLANEIIETLIAEYEIYDYIADFDYKIRKLQMILKTDINYNFNKNEVK